MLLKYQPIYEQSKTYDFFRLMGEIMNVGVYFGGGYEKSSVVFPSLSTSSKEKLDFYLEFHFLLKQKL